jgi:RNA polymerase sigma factor (sigma-70 family)
MSDYRLRLTVRNARLLRAIAAAGHRPGQRFAAAVGIDYGSELRPYLNLTRSPLGADGCLRDSAWALCDFLGASPDELWSDEQQVPLTRNGAHADVTAAQLAVFSAGAPMADDVEVIASRKEVAQGVEAILATLPPPEAAVVRARFGLGTAACTIAEVADRQGLTRERVRQLERNALRQLREPSPRLADLAEAVGITERSKARLEAPRGNGRHA